MASIRITRFAGLMPALQAKQLQHDHAQIAHNTLLWDGTLRPLPAWTAMQVTGSTIKSLVAHTGGTFDYVADPYLSRAMPTLAPMPPGRVGLSASYSGSAAIRLRGLSGYLNANAGVPLGIARPPVSSISQNITSSGQSSAHRPIAFAVAIVALRADGARSAPTVLGISGAAPVPTTLIYPNCSVVYSFTVDAGYTTAYGINRFEFYVTQVPADMAQKPENADDVEWQLFNTQYCGAGLSPPTSVTITWGNGSSRFTLLSEEMFPPYAPDTIVGFGQTEAGRAFVASHGATASESIVALSEKFLWHGWPIRNILKVPDRIGGAVAHYDTIYMPARTVPFRAVVREGDKSAQIDLVPYASPLPFVGGLCRTSFGAAYVSRDGLVGLAGEEAKLLTPTLVNGGDKLYGQFGLRDVVAAEWFEGRYYGFGTSTVGCLVDVPDPMHGAHELAQLVTFDVPGQPAATLVTDAGLLLAVGSTVYIQPLPGSLFEGASPAATYKWRSKVFVAPGMTTMSAAKVVGVGTTAPVTFRLYGDGVLIHTHVVPNSNPFRLPSQHKCLEWEIELEGTRTVHETHVATSMRELTEEA